jgi:hypothetical protein
MRRGQMAESLPWFIRIMMLIAAIVIVVMLVRVYTNRHVESQELHKNTYLYRLYYSDLIMFSDAKTTRVYPGIVDYNKLTDQRLDETFPKPVEREDAIIASKIVVTPKCSLAPKTAFNNKESFEHFKAFDGTLGGAGGAIQETFTFPVTARQDKTACQATLEITIVRLNS